MGPTPNASNRPPKIGEVVLQRFSKSVVIASVVHANS